MNTSSNTKQQPPDGAADYFGKDLEVMDFASNYYDWMLAQFAPYLGRRFLEVGAGSGNFSERLLELNPERLVCVEPAPNVYPLLQTRFEHRPQVQTFNGSLSEAPSGVVSGLDTIFYVNVLEHVATDDIEMRLACEYLEVGGHMLIFVPALPWLYGKADELFGHYRRYTKSGLLKLFDGLPLRVVECHYFDVLGVIPWWVSFVLLQRSVASSAMVRTYDRWVVPVGRCLESIVHPPIGKNLLLVAKRLG